jgi:glycosyltransferase involved in cell wall biosynthesis
LLNFEVNTLILFVLSLFGIGFLLQLVYWWGIFSRLAFYKPKDKLLTAKEAISVVICARNESINLLQNLPLIFSQQYPDFEVVVVNDCSDDETEELLVEMAHREPRLKVVHLRQSLNFFRGKKFPLSMGIKSAKNEILVLTDADCKPESENWLQNMADTYHENTEVVLGYGPYERRNSLLNLLIRFDTLHIGMQYLSFALAGLPYMGVGRNLSYRKSLFIHNKGFTSHYNIPSGDDDLFISQVAHAGNTEIVVAEGSRTNSAPKTNLSGWIRQKRRHLSTARYYKKNIKLVLGLYHMSQLLFWGGLVAVLMLPFSFLVPLGVLLVKLSTQLWLTKRIMNRLGEKKILLFSPFAEIFFILFNPLIVAVNLLKKPGKWK